MRGRAENSLAECGPLVALRLNDFSMKTLTNVVGAGILNSGRWRGFEVLEPRSLCFLRWWMSFFAEDLKSRAKHSPQGDDCEVDVWAGLHN